VLYVDKLFTMKKQTDTTTRARLPRPTGFTPGMRQRCQHAATALLLLGLLGCPVPIMAGDMTPATSRHRLQGKAMYAQAPNFALLDQHDNPHTLQFPQPQVSVLIFADYAGSAQLEDWIRPIYARYQRTIALHGIAELSAVPPFIRGLVRSAFQERVQYPVMLDWHGTVSKSYAYESGQANLLVVDALGRIMLRVIGAVDATKLHQVTSLIDQLLPQ
jgi:hypothetical protein